MVKASLIKLEKYSDDRGYIMIFQDGLNLNFGVKRVYLIKGVPKNKERGHHAHRKLQQLLIPLCGSVTVDLSDNSGSKSFILSSPDNGLYIYGPTWRILKNFSSDCILMVLASEDFDPDDYIDDYSAFLNEYST